MYIRGVSGDDIMLKCIASAAAIIALLSAYAIAQTTEKNPLARVEGACSASSRSMRLAAGRTGEPQAEVKQSSLLSLDVDEIDTDDGTARDGDVGAGPCDGAADGQQPALHGADGDRLRSMSRQSLCLGAMHRSLRAVLSRHDYLPMSIPGFTSRADRSRRTTGSAKLGQ